MPPHGVVLGHTPSGGQVISIGNAIFTVTANTQPFASQMMRARQNAQRASQAIQQSLTGGTRNAAMGFLELSRAVEDAQYGFSAIVNNIPQIALGFGMGAGVAGAVSLAAVAVSQLVKYWDDLKDVFASNWLGVPAEQLAKMRENAEAAAEAFEKLARTPTKAEKERAGVLGGAITEQGAEKMAADIARAMTLTGEGEQPTDEERIALKAVKNARPDTKAGVEGRIFGRINEENRKRAERMIGEMSEPGGANSMSAQTMRRMADRHPGLFPPGFLGDIERMDPAEQKKQADLERRGELNAANMANEKRLRDEEAKRIEQQKGFEIKGRENARAFDKKQEELKKKRQDAQAKETEAQRRSFLGNKEKGEELKDRVRHMLRGQQDFEDRHKTRSEFVGLVEFAKQGQTAALNQDTKEIQKRQANLLEEIRDLIKKNPNQADAIMNAVAAGPG